MAGLEGRVALVSGGGRGIGRAICLRLARDGADIAVNYARDAEAANEVRGAVQALGRRAEIYQADVADEAAVEAMCARAIADFGQIGILVNNAGIGSSYVDRPSITGATRAQWALLLGANLWGPIHMCRALVPHMRAAARSDVVMISSTTTLNLSANMGLYSVGKAGAEALAHTLAKEERQHGMRVNIVAPGLVDTDMGRKLITLLPGPDDMRERDATAPFGFVCTPNDIAAEVAHLVSEDGRYITNQRIYINGGGF